MGVVGSLPEEVDVVVIGGGAGGYTAAIRAAEAGKSVALVESDKLGGSCLNYTCIPTITMVNISKKFDEIKNMSELGITAEPKLDYKKALQHRMNVSSKLSNGVGYLLKMNGVEVFNAEATFLSSNSVQISSGVTLEFKKAIIASGTKLKDHDVIKVDGTKIIDNRQALELDHVPDSVTVVDNGYAAVEFSSIFKKFGSKEVYVISEKGLFSFVDQELIDMVRSNLKSLGIEVYENDKIQSYEDGKIKLASGKEVSSDLIVVAPERIPSTDSLSLSNTKVQLDDKGFIKVDKSLQTTDPNIYASGDVIGQPMSATKALRTGVIAGESASGIKSELDYVAMPEAIFSDPPIGYVGKLSGDGIKTVKFPLTASGRAIAENKTTGFVKIAYDEDGIVKGVSIIGEGADTMISEATLAIEMGASLEDIADTIHPHPTYSEGLEEAAEGGLGRPIDFFLNKKQ